MKYYFFEFSLLFCFCASIVWVEGNREMNYQWIEIAQWDGEKRWIIVWYDVETEGVWISKEEWGYECEMWHVPHCEPVFIHKVKGKLVFRKNFLTVLSPVEHKMSNIGEIEKANYLALEYKFECISSG